MKDVMFLLCGYKIENHVKQNQNDYGNNFLYFLFVNRRRNANLGEIFLGEQHHVK